MALVQGSVAVDDNGIVTFAPPSGPNLAREYYEALMVMAAAQITPEPMPTGPDAAPMMTSAAMFSNMQAAVVVSHITLNAEVYNVALSFMAGGVVAMLGIPVEVDPATHQGATTADGALSGLQNNQPYMAKIQ